MASREEILRLLAGVVDPELRSDIVSLGMVRDVRLSPDGDVELVMALTTAGCPLRAQIKRDVEARIGGLPGVRSVSITWAEMTPEEKARAMATARKNAAAEAPDTEVPPEARVLAVASGKGGVGKTSVTVNLAAALALRGLRVGVLDADIWGFSVPRMLGVEGRLRGTNSGEKRRILPARKKVGNGVLEIVSMGLLVDDESSALMWRGLILSRAVRHFLEDVAWGELDYLLIDMPPGTGDVQMGLARMLPRTEMIVVTTPAISAQKVAIRAVNMARKSYLRVVGAVENMSSFTCAHGETYRLFGSGGGQLLATEAGVPLLGSIPLEPAVADGSDRGEPVVLASGEAADAFRRLAAVIAEEAAPALSMAGCSARIIAAAEAALDAHGHSAG